MKGCHAFLNFSGSYVSYFIRHKIARDASKYFSISQKCSNTLNTIVPHVSYLNVLTKSITNYNFDEWRSKNTMYVSLPSVGSLKWDRHTTMS